MLPPELFLGWAVAAALSSALHLVEMLARSRPASFGAATPMIHQARSSNSSRRCRGHDER